MRKIIIIDPEEFWEKLDEKIKDMSRGETATPIKWLRSADVREMLNISDSTLQSLRINKTIPAYRLGNSWFYKYDEILDALENGRTLNREECNQ